MTRRRDDRLFPPWPMTPREADVAELVRERPGITLAELADALGVGLKRVDQIVNRLEARGRIQRLPATSGLPRFDR